MDILHDANIFFFKLLVYFLICAERDLVCKQVLNEPTFDRLKQEWKYGNKTTCMIRQKRVYVNFDILPVYDYFCDHDEQITNNRSVLTSAQHGGFRIMCTIILIGCALFTCMGLTQGKNIGKLLIFGWKSFFFFFFFFFSFLLKQLFLCRFKAFWKREFRISRRRTCVGQSQWRTRIRFKALDHCMCWKGTLRSNNMSLVTRNPVFQVFRPGKTQTGLLSCSDYLEA